jgi:hypothetical protein
MAWKEIKKEFDFDLVNTIPILVLKGVESDLELISLRRHNAIFCRWGSPLFHKYFQHVFSQQYIELIESLDEITAERSYDEDDNIFILGPTRKDVSIESLEILYAIIRLIFPSRFQILYKFQIDKISDQDNCPFLFWRYDDLNYTEERKLNYGDNSPNVISLLIARIKVLLDKVSYIKLALEYFIISTEIKNISLAFVALNICLEVFVKGNLELKYRISRHLSIICGKNEESSLNIFQNIQKLYDLRSAIVHGEIINKYEIVKEYYDYLNFLVSVSIIEISKHSVEEIDTLQKLDQKLSSLAFGQYRKLTSRYSNLGFHNTDCTILDFELKKFKRSGK